jgi:hypothetical protein
MRVRYRTPKRRRPEPWPTPEQELAEGVPLDRYTSALARWQATAPHWFVNGFQGRPWPDDGSSYSRQDAIRDLEQAHKWEDACRAE